jgi:hypothetical protein
VSLLKKKVGDATIVSSKLPVSDKEGRMQIIPLAILDRKLMKKGNGAATAVLVQWSNLNQEDATREDLSDLQKQFPDCQAIFKSILIEHSIEHSCGQESIQGRSIVIAGINIGYWIFC